MPKMTPYKRKVRRVARKVQARHGGSLTKREARTRARGIIRARKRGVPYIPMNQRGDR